jgi:hypothetical protein
MSRAPWLHHGKNFMSRLTPGMSRARKRERSGRWEGVGSRPVLGAAQSSDLVAPSLFLFQNRI